EDEEVSLGTDSSSNLQRVKKEMQIEIDALNKMLHATLAQLSTVKKERDEKSQMLATYQKVKQAERQALDEALRKSKDKSAKELKMQLEPQVEQKVED